MELIIKWRKIKWFRYHEFSKDKEIEAVKTVSVEQVRQQEHSIKDEILTILISAIFVFTFLPFSQPYMTKGFEILKSAPTEFWWAVLIVFSGSFGMSTLKNIKGKKQEKLCTTQVKKQKVKSIAKVKNNNLLLL